MIATMAPRARESCLQSLRSRPRAIANDYRAKRATPMNKSGARHDKDLDANGSIPPVIAEARGERHEDTDDRRHRVGGCRGCVRGDAIDARSSAGRLGPARAGAAREPA